MDWLPHFFVFTGGLGTALESSAHSTFVKLTHNVIGCWPCACFVLLLLVSVQSSGLVACLVLVFVEVESFPVKKEGGNGQAGFSLRGFGARSPKFSLGFHEMILV